jgi:hypothetical protein
MSVFADWKRFCCGLAVNGPNTSYASGFRDTATSRFGLDVVTAFQFTHWHLAAARLDTDSGLPMKTPHYAAISAMAHITLTIVAATVPGPVISDYG